jgi:hypothetical protein
MRILFDQGAPVPTAGYLREHSVRTALEEGWDILVNGELLRVAEEAGFGVLLTADNLLISKISKAAKSRSSFSAATGGGSSKG